MVWKVTNQGADLWVNGTTDEGGFTSFIEWVNTETGVTLLMEQDYDIYGDVTLPATGERVGMEPFFSDVNDNYAEALRMVADDAPEWHKPRRDYWLNPGLFAVYVVHGRPDGWHVLTTVAESYGEGPEVPLGYHGWAEQCEALDTAIRLALASERNITTGIAVTDADLDGWVAETEAA